MKNILVSIDFNKGEDLIIKKAIEIAEKFNSKVWIIHITAPEPDFVGYNVGPEYIRENRANELRKEHKILEEHAKNLNDQGIEAQGLLIQGATIEMILEESKKLKVDLIIAGHQEHNFIYKAFIGSVSAGLIKKSKIPILIVPIE
ncbi:MAG TPA: universal stress protein [Xanthomarina sp.]|nr:universal stress protein [Xanthomarina sp.]